MPENDFEQKDRRKYVELETYMTEFRIICQGREEMPNVSGENNKKRNYRKKSCLVLFTYSLTTYLVITVL